MGGRRKDKEKYTKLYKIEVQGDFLRAIGKFFKPKKAHTIQKNA